MVVIRHALSQYIDSVFLHGSGSWFWNLIRDS